jgi:hypothetical protein
MDKFHVNQHRGAFDDKDHDVCHARQYHNHGTISSAYRSLWESPSDASPGKLL